MTEANSDFVPIDADSATVAKLWAYEAEHGGCHFDEYARSLGLRPPDDLVRWEVVVGLPNGAEDVDLYWVPVEPYIPQEWPVEADDATLADLRERLRTESGREVALYAEARGVRPPDDERWQITEFMHDGRMALFWIQYHPESWEE